MAWRIIFGVNWEMWLFQRKPRIHMSLFISPKLIMKRVEVCSSMVFICIVEYLKQVACIHQYVLAAPFHKYLSALSTGTQASLKPKIVSFYPKEPMFVRFIRMNSSYIVPSASTVSVVFSICENDDTDRALMQVFLLEFSEAKRTVPGCPSVSFSRDDPAEIRDLRVGDKPSAGYLVFCRILW